MRLEAACAAAESLVAAWPTKNRSRGYAPLCGFSPPHFCGCWKPTVSFIATAKTSYTTGTLYAMGAKIGWKLYNKKLLKNG
jgi:hypothetical protein